MVKTIDLITWCWQCLKILLFVALVVGFPIVTSILFDVIKTRASRGEIK